MSCCVVVSSAWASAGPPVIPATISGNCARTASRSAVIASICVGAARCVTFAHRDMQLTGTCHRSVAIKPSCSTLLVSLPGARPSHATVRDCGTREHTR